MLTTVSNVMSWRSSWRDSATGGQQHRLIEVPRNAGKHRSVITQDPDQSLPRHFYMDIPEFVFVYEPQEVEQIRVQCLLPQDELTDIADILTLGHWRAVTDLATGYAMEERGEELGPQSALYFKKAEDALAKAISQGVSHSPLEMTMDAGQLHPGTRPGGGGW